MKTVLIAEDEKLIRQGIKSMILRSGVPVQTIIECSNGQIAWETLSEQQVDLVFTDIRMPKLDGIALVQKLQELPQKPFVVVISGYDDFTYAVEMLRLGVKEYILKPIDREQIADIMRRMECEIAKSENDSETMREAGYQQLRWLCTAPQLSKDEITAICRRCDNDFTKGEYEVCCCNYDGEDYEQGNSYLFLPKTGNHDLFLVHPANREFLLKNELKDCYVGFSRLVSGTASLREAYQQARAARYLAYTASKRVVDYEEDHAALISDRAQLSQETQHKLENAIHLLGTERVNEAVTLIEELGNAVAHGALDVNAFYHGIRKWLEDITRNYENVLKMEKDNILELQDIYQYQTIGNYISALTDWMRWFHDYISEEFDDYKNKQKLRQAISYIHENYNKELNMAMVSNHISMNYSLFSYGFKQYTGQNFVNYLKGLRIQEAKRLLETTEMRINEISAAVGYENVKHFMKLFKAECGISPTEYRKSSQLKN